MGATKHHSGGNWDHQGLFWLQTKCKSIFRKLSNHAQSWKSWTPSFSRFSNKCLGEIVSSRLYVSACLCLCLYMYESYHSWLMPWRNDPSIVAQRLAIQCWLSCVAAWLPGYQLSPWPHYFWAPLICHISNLLTCLSALCFMCLAFRCLFLLETSDESTETDSSQLWPN